MKNKYCALALSLILVSFSLQSKHILDTWVEKAKSHLYYKTLQNGLTILFYKLPTTKEVYLKMVYDVGSRHEKQYQHGLAHMIEHMLFKGTEKVSETDLQLIAQKFGNTRFNAYTSMDQTAYYFITDNKNWSVFLDIMADCMVNASFKEHHFASEVKAVINELNMTRSNPKRKTIITALSSVFPINHPYHHSTIGNREDLVNASAQDLKNFYKKHYTPDKATLIVVGNLDKKDVFKKAKELFSPIPEPLDISTKNINTDAFLPSDFIQKNMRIHTQTKQPHMIIYWKVPGKKSTKAYVSQALTYIMNQRLKKLKDRFDLVYSAQAANYTLFDGGIFGITLTPKIESYSQKMLPTSCTQQCTTFIKQQLADLHYAGPTHNELDQYKALYKSWFIENFESCKDIATMLEDYTLHKNKYQAFDTFLLTQELSRDDIKKFCGDYLQDNVACSIECLPLQDKEKKAWSSLQAHIEAYEKKLLEKKQRQTTIEEPRLFHTLPQPEMIDFSFEKPDITATLSNGIKVYIRQRTHIPTVTMTCSLINSQMLDLHFAMNNKSLIPSMGHSQLLEETAPTTDHPEAFSKKEHTDFFHAHGASCRFSSKGGIMSCISSDFNTLAKRFFHITTHPTYPQNSLNKALFNTIQSLIKNQKNAQHLCMRELSGYLYRDYPWTRTDQQLIEEIKLYTRDDLIAFHKQYIQPHNLAITVIGDVDPQETLNSLESIIGSWKTKHKKTTIPFIEMPIISNPSPTGLSVFFPKEQVMICGGRLTTRKGTDEQRALILIEHYLNRQLYLIREQTGLFYYCHARLAPTSFHTKGHARIITQTNQCTAGQVIKQIQKALAELYHNGLPASSIEMIKRNQIFDLAKSFSTNDSLAEVYQYLIDNNLPFDYYDTYLAAIADLTPEKINVTVKKYCNPDEWSFVQVGRVTGHVTT